MCIKPGLDSNRAPAASPPTLIPRRLLPLLLAVLPQAASRFVIASGKLLSNWMNFS